MRRFPLLFAGLFAASLTLAPLTTVHAKTPADQLIVGMSMINLLSLDPAAATGLDVSEVNANLYDMLLVQDVKQPDQLVPALAESWQVSDDRRTITFKLRDGVKFQSGNSLSADDVAWSLQRVLKLNLALASTWKAYGFSAENAERSLRADGPNTFVVELQRPTDPQLVLNTLATSPSAFILDRQAVLKHEKNGDLGAAWLTTHAAGSGPFILNDWRANDVILMTRFDGYWDGPAKLKRIVMRNMTESQSLRLMVARGDLDLAKGMAAPDIEALSHDDKVRAQTVQRGTLYYVALSVKSKPFEDARVRKAVRSLIDYQGINQTVMPHYGQLNQRPLPLGLEARLDDPGYTLNVAEAKKLLTEAGYPNGFKTTIRVLTEPPFINIASSLQATLAQAGIQASIITGTGNQIYGAMRERSFDILVGRGGGGAERHPHSSLRTLVYNPDNRDEARLSNFQGWRTSFFSPELNSLIETAEVEPDHAKQLAQYQQIQQRLDEQVGAILPVSQMTDTVVLYHDVQNYQGHTAATTRYKDVYKAR
ncbi:MULTISPECIES: ABC transporter substrate-binding protein [unclassified Pseudomonas]|uniref:ABC transporter substrate-binding protein n=1 Tax=unclassified Pseudomonas TaxID=196821 RepID=UPI0021C756B3|nr:MULTISPECIES: ABC transporter substrate-binding protein [unclassified Pseudomonas]MCU1730427.1 ABC transporter substrate-binding protein [Pseudomonas sp. 20P_3.2_Bac4]MCU1745642.1 ABC transporter substrate-binding protein [Pseudomonas sp. 20P_3.2_Bac5]